MQILSFRLKQQAEPRLENMGWIGGVASFGLAISTATISDGKDMNWTLHSIGATGFFIVTLYNCITVSAVYKDLWQYQHFCARWSYLYKVSPSSHRQLSLWWHSDCWECRFLAGWASTTWAR